MGSFILCRKKIANQPFFLDDVRLNVYTIEELCFYLCNNLYLLNYSIMSRELCSWIDTELDMGELAGMLQKIIGTMSLGRFVVTILSYVGFCDEEELDEISHTLASLKDQSEEEQHKKKADNLVKNGKYEHALCEYERILKMQEKKRSRAGGPGDEFYGQVRHNMGNALARQFRFKEAARQLFIAYQLGGQPESLREYLCACYMYMTPEEFRELLEHNEGYRKTAAAMEQEFSEQERQYRFYQEQLARGYTSVRKRIEDIQEEYRKSLA